MSRLRRGAGTAVLAIATAALGVGCSSGADRDEPSPPRPSADRTTRAALESLRCPPDLADCRVASGRILYVERVDADGDGDAHFVLVSREGITGPGLSVIDVKRSLRPSPLPRPGDLLRAAGLVRRGTYGQRQIEAVEVQVAPGR